MCYIVSLHAFIPQIKHRCRYLSIQSNSLIISTLLTSYEALVLDNGQLETGNDFNTFEIFRHFPTQSFSGLVGCTRYGCVIGIASCHNLEAGTLHTPRLYIPTPPPLPQSPLYYRYPVPISRTVTCIKDPYPGSCLAERALL